MTCLLPFLVGIALLAPPCAAQSNQKAHSRTLSIGGIGREPSFRLNVSAEGRNGTVEVKDAAGAQVQTLTCDLFRDWDGPIAVDPETTARVLDVHAEMFVSGLKSTDMDFDGMPDIVAIRDFGAKWGTACVWLFDPTLGRFSQESPGRQMEDLGNLTVDTARHQIVSFTIGPINPTRDEYRIDDGSLMRGTPRRLLPVRSCELDTPPGPTRIVSVVTYARGQDVVERRTVSADCNDVCGDACPTVPEKKPGG